jgi:hypothetical protein
VRYGSKTFLRFVIADVHEESHQELGIFHAADKLRESGSLSAEEQAALQESRDWFNVNLEKPTRFTSGKPPYYRKKQNGISWFKDSATEHIRKIREIVVLLEHHDIRVRMIKSERPGYVLYEDEFQIVAVPFADADL